MKLTKQIRVTWWLVVGVCSLGLLLVPTAWAQTAKLTINYPEAMEEADRVALRLYFTITDDRGRVIEDSGIESAQIVLEDARYPVTPRKATTDIYIVLALDTSGSITPALDTMRAAAIAALDGAPVSAYFSVIKFNEEIQVLQPFSNDHLQTTNTINRLTIDDSGTCLYDAVVTAIDQVVRATVSSGPTRRAVVVFTDGRDERTRGQGDRCSRAELSDVIQAAQAAPVPIYTIGLIGAQGANEVELQQMAEQTGGLSATGGQRDLRTLFARILDALRSQWLVETAVYPSQSGAHVATLEIQLPDKSLLTAAMPIVTSRSFQKGLPEAPPSILKSDLVADRAQQQYIVELTVENDAQIAYWQLNIKDRSNGLKVADFTFGADTPIVFDPQSLENGKEYLIEIFGLDGSGQFVKDAEGSPILSTIQFKHWTENESEPVVLIDSVEIDRQVGELRVRLTIKDEQEIYEYQVQVFNSNTNILALEFQPTLSVDNSFDVPLGSLDAGKYRIEVRALDANGAVRSVSDEEIQYEPHPSSWWQRLRDGLRDNLYLVLIILLVLIGVVGLLMFRSHQAYQTGTPYLERRGLQANRDISSSLNRTMFGKQDATPSGMEPENWSLLSPELKEEVGVSVTLRLTNSPGMLGIGKSLRAHHFPFTIGREGADFSVAGDLHISRPHARLIEENGQIFLEDTSKNGTFVNGKRVPPGSRVALTGRGNLGLGRHTSLVYEVHRQ